MIQVVQCPLQKYDQLLIGLVPKTPSQQDTAISAVPAIRLQRRLINEVHLCTLSAQQLQLMHGRHARVKAVDLLVPVDEEVLDHPAIASGHDESPTSAKAPQVIVECSHELEGLAVAVGILLLLNGTAAAVVLAPQYLRLLGVLGR